MSEFHITKLEPDLDSEALIRVIRNIWTNTYIDTGLLPDSILDSKFPLTDDGALKMKRNLQRQYDPEDTTVPRYVGVFDEAYVLSGFVKVAKPLAELNRRDGNETFLQKINRKLLGKKPALKAPTLSEICEIGVVPEMQGRGIGKLLLQGAVESLPPEVATVAAFSRVETQPFFEKYGFRPTSQRLYYPVHNDPAGVLVEGMHVSVDELKSRLAR